MSTPDRVIKTKVPARVIVSAVLIGLFVVGFILVAIWQSGRGIHEARMSGTVISKEFQPAAQPEQQITLNRSGEMSSRVNTGQYTIAVQVPMADGTKKTFTVWLTDPKQYEAIKVGDSFDVGPYVIPETKP